MASCLRFRYTFEDPQNPGVYLEVYEQSNTSVQNCGTAVPQERIVLRHAEYTEDMSDYSVFDVDYFTLEQKQEIFVYSFSLPLIVYLVAWAYQLVINFATKN